MNIVDRYDVITIAIRADRGTLAYRLAATGKRILVLERGNFLPLGLKLNESDRSRSPCIRCDTFDGYPCLVEAKADAEISAIRPAREQFSNFTLLTNAKVLRVHASASRREITAVETEINGEIHHFAADVVVVFSGAINSAVLLRSANDQHPNGLANRSDQVGRNFMKHLFTALIAPETEPNQANFQKTIAVSDFYWVQNMGNVLADIDNQPIGRPQHYFWKELQALSKPQGDQA